MQCICYFKLLVDFSIDTKCNHQGIQKRPSFFLARAPQIIPIFCSSIIWNFRCFPSLHLHSLEKKTACPDFSMDFKWLRQTPVAQVWPQQLRAPGLPAGAHQVRPRAHGTGNQTGASERLMGLKKNHWKTMKNNMKRNQNHWEKQDSHACWCVVFSSFGGCASFGR